MVQHSIKCLSLCFSADFFHFHFETLVSAFYRQPILLWCASSASIKCKPGFAGLGSDFVMRCNFCLLVLLATLSLLQVGLGLVSIPTGPTLYKMPLHKLLLQISIIFIVKPWSGHFIDTKFCCKERKKKRKGIVKDTQRITKGEGEGKERKQQ